MCPGCYRVQVLEKGCLCRDCLASAAAGLHDWIKPKVAVQHIDGSTGMISSVDSRSVVRIQCKSDPQPYVYTMRAFLESWLPRVVPPLFEEPEPLSVWERLMGEDIV
jgi:hypothetical protein